MIEAAKSLTTGRVESKMENVVNSLLSELRTILKNEYKALNDLLNSNCTKETNSAIEAIECRIIYIEENIPKILESIP